MISGGESPEGRARGYCFILPHEADARVFFFFCLSRRNAFRFRDPRETWRGLAQRGIGSGRVGGERGFVGRERGGSRRGLDG